MFKRLHSPLLILLLALAFPLTAKLAAYEPLISIGKPDLQDILYSPDGRFLATLTASYLELLDAETFAPVTRSKMDGDKNKLAFSPDSSLLAIFRIGTGIRIWHVDSETFLETIPADTRAVEFSPDGRYLAYSDGDSVLLWDVEQRKTVIELTGDPEPLSIPEAEQRVKAFAFHPNSRILAVGSIRKTIALWDIQTQEIVSYLELKGKRRPSVIRFSHDGNLLAALTNRINVQPLVRLWNMATGDTQYRAGFFSDVIFTPDDQRLLAGGRDGNLHIIQVDTFDIEKRAAVHHLPPPNIGWTNLRRLTFHPDGKSFACLINESRIGIWDARNFSWTQTIYGYNMAGEYADAVYLPKANRIVTGGKFSTTDVLIFWDATTGELLRASEYFMPTECLETAPDGRRIAMSWGEANEIWDASTAKRLHVLPKFSSPNSGLTFSPSGKYLASNNWQGTHVWNTRTEEKINLIHNESSKMPLLLFTSNEQQILTIPDEKEMTEFWDIETGELVKAVNKIGPMVNVGDDFVQARQRDDTMEIYMFRSGKRLCRIPDIPETTGWSMFWRNRFHPSGNLLAVRYEEGDSEFQGYKFYSSHTGNLLATAPDIRHIRFTANGDYMFMVNDDDQWGLYLTSDVLGKPVPHVFTDHAFHMMTTFGQIKQDQLLQNYPNPFNPDTWIPYQLKIDSAATVTIYDSIGQIVRTLDLGHKKSGYHTAHWDGKDDSGQTLASGIFFYAIRTDDGFSDIRKMVLLR